MENQDERAAYLAKGVFDMLHIEKPLDGVFITVMAGPVSKLG